MTAIGRRKDLRKRGAQSMRSPQRVGERARTAQTEPHKKGARAVVAQQKNQR